MASPSPRKKLRDEATCPICMDFFTDPVITSCGHNLCRGCVSKCLSNSVWSVVCPRCRGRVHRKDLMPNRQLANFVEITKELRMQEGGTGWWRFCERHQEPLTLFCKEDKIPICLICDKSSKHQGHAKVSGEEAVQEYKEWIGSKVEILRKEKEKILEYKAETERESEDLLKEIKEEEEKTLAELKQLHDILYDQEKCLLTKMEEVTDEIDKRSALQDLRFSKELSSLGRVIQEMEEEFRQPAGELLQDIQGTLNEGSMKRPFEKPVAFPPALKWKIWEFHDTNVFLEGLFAQFKDAVVCGIQEKKAFY
ncbi:zinc finger protein RFP-like isoform X2 [Hemicordylus capensis]|uniref:zinc finger protein RFP-like isoform X2 n=1 Tax=Hemicordylus capensis TaxID=884348 RepID=UPI0023023A4B|nr:zinc finger protein RFP-like isoform X2 [Hemicordylus capensis]